MSFVTSRNNINLSTYRCATSKSKVRLTSLSWRDQWTYLFSGDIYERPSSSGVSGFFKLKVLAFQNLQSLLLIEGQPWPVKRTSSLAVCFLPLHLKTLQEWPIELLKKCQRLMLKYPAVFPPDVDSSDLLWWYSEKGLFQNIFLKVSDKIKIVPSALQSLFSSKLRGNSTICYVETRSENGAHFKCWWKAGREEAQHSWLLYPWPNHLLIQNWKMNSGFSDCSKLLPQLRRTGTLYYRFLAL